MSAAAATARRGIPEASVARLPGYLRALTSLAREGIASVSSEELATASGVSSAMLRKDLSHLGSYGVRGVGYDVERLASEITSTLGLTQEWPVAIVGMGNLGRALAAYRGFAERGFRKGTVRAICKRAGVNGAAADGLEDCAVHRGRRARWCLDRG